MKYVSGKYILSRWSKRIRRRHTLKRASYKTKKDDPNVSRYDLMCKKLYDFVEVACESDSATQFVISQLESISSNPSIACSNKGANCLQPW